MKHILPVGFAFALLSSAFAACTMDFDQFQPGPGGAGGTGGACATECCAVTDCPEPAEPCMQATCNAGTCGEEPRADGSEAGMQTAGDCKKVVCQDGEPTSEADATDSLDDGNDCTDDVCDGETPASNPVAAGTACASSNGKVCDGQGACVGCLMDGDCPPETPNCDTRNSICVSAQCGDGDKNGDETDVDCGGSCPPCTEGQDCEVGSDCTSGVCSGGAKKCAPPVCGDGVKNGSETDVDCGGSCPDCGPGQGCDEDNDCEGNDCTGQGGTCVPNCDDNVQNNNETDVDCGGNDCKGCDVGDSCDGDGDCALDNCVANVCDEAQNGHPCGGDGDCLSGQCEDGVCCNTSCNGTCRACDLPGSVGTCLNIASGSDPDNECAGASVCDGAGACKKPAGQTCAAASECLVGLFCVDGVCCDSVCNGTCEACNVAGSLGACTEVPNNQDPANECAGATTCDGAGACTKLANGTACGAAAECSSNFCVDGVCCNEICGGTCRACDLAGTIGTCTNVPAGQDPDMECQGANPNCNGMAMCGP